MAALDEKSNQISKIFTCSYLLSLLPILPVKIYPIHLS